MALGLNANFLVTFNEWQPSRMGRACGRLAIMIHPDLPDSPDHAQDERVNRLAAVSMSSVQFPAIFVVGVRSRQLKVQRASPLSDVLSSFSSRRLLTSPASSPSVAAGLKMEAAIPGSLGGYQRVISLALPRS